MIANSYPRTSSPSALITGTQNAAIFAVCANLFSTALANLGFAVFLLLFICTCLSGQRRYLDTRNFPAGVAIAIGIYIGWMLLGLTYTAAPMSYALKSVFSDRKILYILPLVLVFSDGQPKRRFLISFLALSAVGMLISYALKTPLVHEAMASAPSFKFIRSSAPLMPDNVFRSYATQSMVFAIAAFLAVWFATQYKKILIQFGFCLLALAFAMNIALLTPGRSGYLVFLVLVIWCFTMWRGFRGVVWGTLVALCIGALALSFSSSVYERVMTGLVETQNFSTVAQETSLGRRMLMNQATRHMIRERPLLGVGTGGFKQRFSAMAVKNYTGWRAIPFDDPHNQYLFITAENGVIGLLAFLAVIGTILRQCLKSGSIYGKMAAGCLLAWCATSLFSGHFRTFPEGHLIAFIVGILMVNRSPRGQ